MKAMRIAGERPRVTLAVLAAATLGLSACDGAPSATPARSHAANDAMGPLGAGSRPDAEGGATRDASYASSATRGSDDGAYGERPTARADLDADAPRYHGKPIWAANRAHSSQDNADYQFKKNGTDLGVDSEDAFIAKAHDFVDHPPAGAETLKRANGDTLVYDAKANLFAVVDKDGAPRTLFKPRDGAAYWAQQKADADKPYTSYRRTAAKSAGGDDNG